MKPMAKTKNCELCDSAFECKGLLGCWCRSMDISREQLSELSKRTSDCICPNCLAGYKDRELPSFLNLLCQAVLRLGRSRFDLNFAKTGKEPLVQSHLLALK